MNPEVRLLLTVAAWESTPERSDAVRAAARSVSWAGWMSLVVRHRLEPHASRQLAAAGVRAPDDISNQLASATRATALRALAMTRQLAELTRAFSAHGVPVLPIKGPVLAVAAYGDVGARSSVDLDLVVAPGDLARAEAAMRSAGYESRHGMTPAQERALQSSFGHFEYARDGEPAKVELHWRFAPPRYPWQMPVSDVLARASRGSGTDPTLTLRDPHDALLLQVMHGARHQWSCLEWLVALAASFERMSPDPVRLLDLASRHHSRRALHVALILARDLVGARLAPGLAESAGADIVAGALARETTAVLELADVERWIPDPDRFALDQMDGAADRLRYRAASVFTPTVREWELVRLPDALLPLYYPIRLGRLVLRTLRGGIARVKR